MSRLMMRRRDRPVVAGGFNPGSIDWFFGTTADALVGSTADGAAISQWDDVYGAGNNAAQADSARQPLFRQADAQFNSQPTVEFDGSNDYLLTPDFADIPQPFEVFCVSRFRSGSGSRRIAGLHNSGGQYGSIGSSGTSLWYFGMGVVLSSTLSVATAPRMIRAIGDGTSSSITVDATTTTGNAGTNPITRLALGAEVAGNLAGPVSIAAFFIKSGLMTAQERSDMRSWAQTKFGVA